MPSTIIGSTSWNSTGLVLSAQSAQEQITGLVNVQVTYVAPATKQAQASAKFYTDAPPPIWPSVVSRSELVTNNLYMVDRTIERANGLVTITANYAGALQRAGFKGYYLREQIEYGKAASAYNYGTTETGITLVSSFVAVPVPGGGTRQTTFGTAFQYEERIKVVEFVRIGSAQSVQLPTFVRSDMASILQQRGTGISVWNSSTGTNSFSNAPEANAADIWVVSGPDEARQAGLLSFEKTTPVPSTESSSYVTPTVQVVSLTYRLSR
jgi:hypothetical protein